MSELSDPTAGDEGGLGALLMLLNGAADSFRTVQATYRTWRHEQRLREAFRIHHAEQVRRGVATSITASAVRSGDPGPAETEETVRVWREGQRVRQEHHGGGLDGSYGVADGPLWWSWSEQMGAISNQDDPSVGGGGIDRGFEVMLDPASLVGLLDLRVAGNSRIASRATVIAHAAPRQEGLRDVRALSYPRAFRALHALGTGADSYQLEIDQERGVLLAATAIHNEQPFYKITTLAIRFDEPIPPETFQFRPPEGEQIQSPRTVRNRPQLVSLTEAQRRAAFTVLIPDRMPTGWQMYCMFDEASQHPPSQAPHVLLNYRSDDGRQSVSISQVAAADASQHYGNIRDDESWQEVLRDGTSIKIRSAGEFRSTQAHLTRNGTSVRLSSHSLAADQLATIAAGLRPAPSTGNI
jgi:hypothetical protein